MIFILGSSKTNNVIKKYGSKWGITHSGGIWYLKIILILLIKVIIIYVKYVSKDLALRERFQSFNSFWAYINFTIVFMNFLKKFLVGSGTKDWEKASGGVKVLVGA